MLVKPENIENGRLHICKATFGGQQSKKNAFSGGYPEGVFVCVAVCVWVLVGVKVCVSVCVAVCVWVLV